MEIQRCIRVACAPLVFRLNGEKWICLSFRTRRVLEIDVTSRPRDGETVKMDSYVHRRAILLTASYDLYLFLMSSSLFI